MNIGLDLLDIERLEKHLGSEAFMRRLFSENERDYIAGQGTGAAQTAAGIFCAKEALAKASGMGLLKILREHEVFHKESGQPFFELPGVSLSITHTEKTAAAVVLYEEPPLEAWL